MREFVRCGIHTRLTNTINSVGGIDYNYRIRYLMRTFNVDVETAKLIYGFDVEQHLKTMTLDEIIDLAKSEKNKKGPSELDLYLSSLYATLGGLRRRGIWI